MPASLFGPRRIFDRAVSQLTGIGVISDSRAPSAAVVQDFEVLKRPHTFNSWRDPIFNEVLARLHDWDLDPISGL